MWPAPSVRWDSLGSGWPGSVCCALGHLRESWRSRLLWTSMFTGRTLTCPLLCGRVSGAPVLSLEGAFTGVPLSIFLLFLSLVSHRGFSWPFCLLNPSSKKNLYIFIGCLGVTHMLSHFSRFVCKNNGVLFENQLLQIGLKSEFRQNLGMCLII